MASPQIRIGQGYDVHCFAAGRPLVLAGVQIPYELGLAGHSDADVLLHALTDALLGAAGLADIGTYFPDNNPAYKNADSRELLKTAWGLVSEQGWQLVNCDLTLLAEAPKIAPYVNAMKESIAEVLAISINQIGLKATTTEGLGFVGRKEGMAAMAVVLLVGEGRK